MHSIADCAYRIVHVDSYRHMGTSGQNLELSDMFG